MDTQLNSYQYNVLIDMMWHKHRVSYGLERISTVIKLEKAGTPVGEYHVAHSPAQFISYALKYGEITETEQAAWLEWLGGGKYVDLVR